MKKILLGSAIGVALVAGIFLLTREPSSANGQGEKGDPSGEAASEASPQVTLSEEKMASAGVKCVAVTRRTVHEQHTVPGHIEYDGARRVELKASVDVTVRQVFVKPGDPVKPGTRLASFDSSEIGMVRAEVERAKAELRIANQALEWAEEVAQNLDELLNALSEHPSPEVVDTTFENRVLGDHRQAIVSAYSRYRLAEDLWTDIQPAIAKGSVATQVAKQRESNRQVAKADYKAESEQARYEARRRREKARADRDYARRLAEVSRQKLRTVLGANTEISDSESDRTADDSELTRFFLIAPIEGTVEKRLIVKEQRLSAGTPAFVIADTAKLWVAADIRERDWQALSVREGETLLVRVPAVDDREFEARVEYVGRAVDSETHAVPLVAVIENAQRLLRPGMFVWVSLPAGSVENALVVPPSAVLTHEGKDFVFVEEGPRTFRRVDVTCGPRTPEWIAIQRGLEVDQRVVSHGAFILKSELLIEREEE